MGLGFLPLSVKAINRKTVFLIRVKRDIFACLGVSPNSMFWSKEGDEIDIWVLGKEID